MVQKTQDSGFSLIEEEKKRMLEAAKQKASRKEDKKKPKQKLVEEVVEKNKQEQALIEEVKDLPPSHVQREIKQENSTERSAANVPQKIAKEKASGVPSVSSQFKEALAFFAPTVIGALGGALIEGTSGAVAGAEAGTSLGEAFRKQKLEEAKLAKSGITTPYQAKSLELRERQLGLEERAEKRRGKGLDLNFAKFGFDKEKAAQLSEKQVGKLQDIVAVEKSIERIDELREEVNTGPLAGRVQNLASWADLSPESFNRMKARTASTLSNYVKSISGAQVTEAEALRLQAVIPDITDAPKVFEDKLKEFKKIVKENKEAFAEAIRTGQPLRAGQIKGLLKAESKFMKQPSRLIPSDNDIDNMSAEQLKKYLGN